MAVRRPAPPRVHPDQQPSSAPTPPAPSADAAAPASPRTERGRSLSRRTMVLASTAVAAVAVPTAAAGILLSGRSGAPSSAGSAPGSAEGEETGPFSDVAGDDAQLEAMVWADEHGVQPALDDGSYAPQQQVDRGALAVALHRFAGAPPVTLDTAPPIAIDIDDEPECETALLWLHGRGALWGDASLMLHPREIADAAAARQILTALLGPSLAAVDAAGTLADALPLSDDDAPMTRGSLAQLLFSVDAALRTALG